MSLARSIFERKACPDSRGTFWSVVSKNPLIIYLQGYRSHMIYLHNALRGRETYVLRGSIGCEDYPKSARRWYRYFKKAKRYFPEHRLLFLCNTTTARDNFQARGLPAVFCNQNGLLDENIFTIVKDVPKEFDAVYNAQMEKVKRHWLASRIERLALITYRLDSQPKYSEKTKEILRNAAWLNSESGEYKWIPSEQLSYHLNRARVGLMLSQAEGANYAAVEYMLSGLPVVSTASLGGREVFFDKEYVKVVDACPEAVEQGVREMIARHIDPELIREKTLEKMKIHRNIFIDILQKFCDEVGVRRDMRAEWPEYFYNKMSHWQGIQGLQDLAPDG
jgi:glycosyltransferase involved in cell wall biosynthesis